MFVELAEQILLSNFVELVKWILLSNFVELETINRTNRILTIFYDLQIARQINLVELL